MNESTVRIISTFSKKHVKKEIDTTGTVRYPDYTIVKIDVREQDPMHKTFHINRSYVRTYVHICKINFYYYPLVLSVNVQMYVHSTIEPEEENKVKITKNLL